MNRSMNVTQEMADMINEYRKITHISRVNPIYSGRRRGKYKASRYSHYKK